MGVDGPDQLQLQRLDRRQVVMHLLLDRIDDQRLAAATRGQQIGVGA
jgi:hypothetical protein